MPSGTNTPKLDLLRIQEDWKFGDESFNEFIDDADNKLVGVAHLQSPMHWTEWTERTLYYKDDVVRYPNLHSHQYARCLQDGTSDIKANIPTNNVTGSIFTDGTTKWEVCSLTQVDADNGTIRIWLGGGVYYHRGDAVRYGDALYRAKIDHESGVTFDLDENKWQEIYASIRFWKSNTYYYLDDTAIYDDIIYKCIRAHKSVSNFETVGSTTGDEDDWEIIGGAGGAKDWQSDTKYQLGQLVLVHGILYRCNTKHRSSNSFSTDIANWDLVDAQIHDWQTAQYYVAGTLVAYNNIIYKCLTSHTASANFETDISNWTLYHNHITVWNRNKTYYQGQIVIYSGSTDDYRLYRCSTTHVSPNEIVENEGTENETTRNATFLDDILNWDTLDASIALWKKNNVYKIGDIVLYNNEPFRCVKNHTSGNANDSTIFDDITDNISMNCWEYIGTKNAYIFPWQASTHYNVNQFVTYNNTLYKCNTLHTSGVSFDTTKWDLVYANIQPWTTGIIYKIYSIVLQDGHLYVCNTTHTASTFSSDRANWDEVGGGASIPNWQSGIPYNVNDVVLENGILYRNNAVHTSDTTFADDISYWDIIYANIPLWYANTYYPLGTMVVYNNRLYKCITAHISSSFIADSAKWQLIYGYDIKHEVEGYELVRGMNVKVTEDKLLVANNLLKDIRATNDTNELNLMGVKELTNSEIFNNWVTFTCNPAGGYWNDTTNTDQADAKNSYSFNTTYDAIICSRNNDAFSAFISQETYAPSFTADYTIDNRILAQIDPALCGDDDGLFFILGFMQDDNGDYHTLSVIRNGDSEAESGPGHGTRFAIAYDLFTSWINSAGSTMKLLASDNTLTTHSWDANSYAKLQVIKTSTTITAKTSQINSDAFAVTLTYTLPATKPSDMTEEQYNNIKYMLENDTKIGFGTQSNCSAFRLSLATGSINGISVYNTNTIQKVYFEDGVQKSITADTTTLLPEEFVYSRLNKKLFYVKNNKEAYEIKLNTLCEPWQSNTLYVLNSLVYYNGSMYKCKQAHISSNMITDISTNWDKINGDAKVENWATSTNYSVGQLVLYGNTIYRCNIAHVSDTFANDTAKWDIIYANIQKWTTGIYYKQNSAIINGNKLYVCLTAHTATTFDSDISNWLKIGGRTDIENWAANTLYKAGEIVLYDNVLYKCNTDNTSSASFLTDVTKWDLIYANIRSYANNTVYKQGSIVIYNNKLYRCTQTHISNTDSLYIYKIYYSSGYVISGYWRDGNTDVPKVTVIDLGAVYDITRLTGTQAGGYSGITYLPIDVSVDGSTYTNFVTYENPDAREGTEVDVSGYARGRYIRFTLNSIRRVSQYISSYSIGLEQVSVYAQQPYWELIENLDTYLYNWQSNVIYEENQVVVYGSGVYRCLVGHLSSNFVSDSAKWEQIGGKIATKAQVDALFI